MKQPILTLGAVALFALLVTGCETDGGISGRIKEKSAVFASLKFSEKRFIKAGVVSSGFTPDMVYMAVGKPSKVERLDENGTELWTYRNYYPQADARNMSFNLNGEQPYQPHTMRVLESGRPIPTSMNETGGAPESIFTTSKVPQGGSMDIADLQSFTLTVVFQNGKAARLTVKPN